MLPFQKLLNKLKGTPIAGDLQDFGGQFNEC